MFLKYNIYVMTFWLVIYQKPFPCVAFVLSSPFYHPFLRQLSFFANSPLLLLSICLYGMKKWFVSAPPTFPPPFSSALCFFSSCKQDIKYNKIIKVN